MEGEVLGGQGSAGQALAWIEGLLMRGEGQIGLRDFCSVEGQLIRASEQKWRGRGGVKRKRWSEKEEVE
jgi:hypothetical protein